MSTYTSDRRRSPPPKLRKPPKQRLSPTGKPIKPRATQAEMEERAAFLIAYAEEHGPVTVRQLYYQAEVHGIPGIDKTEASYVRVQRQVLALRRARRLAYGDIADATRWMRKPTTHNSIEEALQEGARQYRKALWTGVEVEVWCEKDALAGVIYPVTAEYDVPLMVTRGYTSETFAHNAVEAHEGSDKHLVILYLGDFDRSGQDAFRSLSEKLYRFGEEFDLGGKIDIINLAVTEAQIADWNLPTRAPKRLSPADRKWPHAFACELDAIDPETLRGLVRETIEAYLPTGELERTKRIEAQERETVEEALPEWLDQIGLSEPEDDAEGDEAEDEEKEQVPFFRERDGKLFIVYSLDNVQELHIDDGGVLVDEDGDAVIDEDDEPFKLGNMGDPDWCCVVTWHGSRFKINRSGVAADADAFDSNFIVRGDRLFWIDGEDERELVVTSDAEPELVADDLTPLPASVTEHFHAGGSAWFFAVAVQVFKIDEFGVVPVDDEADDDD